MKELDESIWMDIHKHSNGDVDRKEDSINQLDGEGMLKYILKHYKFLKNVKAYYRKDKDKLAVPAHIWQARKDFNIFSFVDYYYSKNVICISDSQPDISIKIQEKYTIDDFAEKSTDDCFSVSPIDGGEVNNSFFIELIDYIIKCVEEIGIPQKSEQGIGDLTGKVISKKINESVWVDIHKHSNGEVERKEDEIPKEALGKLDKCYYYYAYLIVSEDKPETLEGFCDYLEDDLEKYPYKDAIIKYVEDNWADEVADTLDGWVDQARIDYNKDMYECEGVPGGLTPVDVGGMGPAYFPGPNGEPGSGDLPSPTGKVYQQVAPFGIFVNSLYGKRKKKRKKKFRKEDEPCVHSPNAKVYDYVDDYREYVDRTYDNVDKRK